jgi:hypothetical protein
MRVAVRRMWLYLGALTAALAAAGGVAAAPALATGDANTASCPATTVQSSGFREYLPDCRAYEMVTPPYEDGYEVELRGGLAEGELSGGAPQLVGKSLAALNGGPDTATFANEYKFLRSSSGWVTVPLAPSTAAFSVNSSLTIGEFSAVSVTDAGALFLLRKPNASVFEANLYLVEPDGAPRLVGPLLPESTIRPNTVGNPSITPPLPVEFAGTTNDFSHVLYYIRPYTSGESDLGGLTDLWPGDTTPLDAYTPPPAYKVVQSLYEYVGLGHSGGAPRLVGVNNEGHLISQCGAEVGGPPGGLGPGAGAISEDGETIVFTAAPRGCIGVDEAGQPVTGEGPKVNEIYARVGGRETIAVSEPTTGPGGDCEACENENAPQPATFEGASRDGMQIFFSSSQQLLPGTVGRSIYDFNRDGSAGHKLSVVATNVGSGGVAAVSGDASRVYYVSEPPEESEGPPDLYVAHLECPGGGSGCSVPDELTTHIATLSRSDSGEWETSIFRETMSLTPDGLHLVFTSFADLTPGDTSASRQVFMYDAATGVLVRVSVGNNGYNDDGDSTNARIPSASVTNVPEGPEDSAGADEHPAVSDDGSVVVFQSAAALTPQAVESEEVVGENLEPAKNVYEYREGHVYLISDGKSAQYREGAFQVDGAKVIGVSASGDDIFFWTPAQLVSQDRNDLRNLFDARTDGGFPEPAAPECEGEDCQGPSGAAPLFGAPLTATLTGSGNLALSTVSLSAKEATGKKRKQCNKEKRLRHGRCVKDRPRKTKRTSRHRGARS